MRGQPSPAHRSGQAKLVEPLGIVVGDATRQHLTLPRVSWNFESLQLAKNFQRRALALNLRSGRDMLPTQ